MALGDLFIGPGASPRCAGHECPGCGGKWNCTFGCRWPLSVYASRPRTCSECTKYAIRLALNLPAPSPSDGSDAAREKREEGQGNG